MAAAFGLFPFIFLPTAHGVPRTSILKRHVVVGDALIEAWIFGLRGCRRLRALSATWHRYRLLGVVSATAGGFASLTAAQENQLIGHHFGDVHFLALFVLVVAGLQPAVDVHLSALEEVWGHILGAPQD